MWNSRQTWLSTVPFGPDRVAPNEAETTTSKNHRRLNILKRCVWELPRKNLLYSPSIASDLRCDTVLFELLAGVASTPITSLQYRGTPPKPVHRDDGRQLLGIVTSPQMETAPLYSCLPIRYINAAQICIVTRTWVPDCRE